MAVATSPVIETCASRILNHPMGVVAVKVLPMVPNDDGGDDDGNGDDDGGLGVISGGR